MFLVPNLYAGVFKLVKIHLSSTVTTTDWRLRPPCLFRRTSYHHFLLHRLARLRLDHLSIRGRRKFWFHINIEHLLSYGSAYRTTSRRRKRNGNESQKLVTSNMVRCKSRSNLVLNLRLWRLEPLKFRKGSPALSQTVTHKPLKAASAAHSKVDLPHLQLYTLADQLGREAQGLISVSRLPIVYCPPGRPYYRHLLQDRVNRQTSRKISAKRNNHHKYSSALSTPA